MIGVGLTGYGGYGYRLRVRVRVQGINGGQLFWRRCWPIRVRVRVRVRVRGGIAGLTVIPRGGGRGACSWLKPSR